MSEAPWLSVILPTFNGARFLRSALDSVRAEAKRAPGALEIVAIDDGSTDDTVSLLSAAARDLPLRLLQPPRSGNWVANTNLGLAAARGEWASILHQDDLWLPGRLAALERARAAHPSAALFVHPTWFIDEEGARLGLWRCPLPSGPVPPRTFLSRLLVQNFLAMPAPTFRRSLAVQGPGMDASLWYTADWDLWLRLAAAGPCVRLGPPLAAFRVHPASQTASRARGAEMRTQLETVLDRHLRGLSARERNQVERAARFSLEVNVALSGAWRGEGAPWPSLAGRFLLQGPPGWWRYLRDSRILERVLARLRLQHAAIPRPARAATPAEERAP